MYAKKKAAPQPALNPAARCLTVQAAAEYLGTTVWFIRTQCWDFKKTGKGLPHLILGKRIVIDRADLDKFIEKQKVAA